MQTSVLYTVGHSTRPIEAFMEMLRGHRITQLLDVRTVPKSRHNLQFAGAALAASLAGAAIGYQHLPVLGGLRRPRPDSSNGGWRNTSFRGYADHMQTPAFAEAIEMLVERARRERIVCMCAEAVPWRCHRSLIADAVLARGLQVDDIVDATHVRTHRLTPFARVEGTSVTYPSLLDADPMPGG